MRKLTVLLTLAAALSLSAQSIDKPSRITVFVSNPGGGWSEQSGGEFEAGYGLAFEHRFSRKWSTEIAAAWEQHDTQLSLLGDRTFTLRTYPIDVVGRYTFQGVHTRWRPYIGAGLHYVAAPDEPVNVRFEDVFCPEVAVGVDFNAAEAWSLRFDLKHLVREDTPVFDEKVKVSIGVGWRF